MSLRSVVEDGGARLTQLLSRLGGGIFRFPKVHPEEIAPPLLETLGFRAAGAHLALRGEGPVRVAAAESVTIQE